ncbi:substrate-binding domain-containing protein [Bacillus subtilis]|nr:substrate-binding domain-containing protein [Bacillus subtilis]
MKKAVSVILTLSLFLLTACSLEPPQWAKPSNSGNKKDFTIGLSVSTLNNPFFVSLKKGIEKEAEKRGMKVIIVDAQNDSSKQTSDVEDLIQQGVDALLINPTDSSAISTAVESANAVGVPVVTIDRSTEQGNKDALASIKNGKLSATVAQQPELIGKLATEAADDILHGKKVQKTISAPLKLETQK